jgi:peroxiredoxin Q/BCP
MKMTTITLIGLGVIVLLLIALRPRTARAAMLQEGDAAPPITTQMVVGDRVEPFSLESYRGRKIVLYFYPKDDTPGCTREACAFRDGYAMFERARIAVFGCSVDSADSHLAFIRKYKLPFALLLDPERKIATAYGAANGIPILGLDRRITYVIGADGRILKVYPNVDPSSHAEQILRDVGSPNPAALQMSPASPSRH